MTFLIGADPEIFVAKRGKIVSAYGMIKGTKKEPHKVKDGAIQVDGMAVEFNIDPVKLDYYNFGEFNKKVISVIGQLKEAVKENHAQNTLKVQPVADFDEEYLEAQPEEAKELGCDPDYDAYTLKPNPRPDAKVFFRTTAGHLHYGWDEGIPVDHPDHLKICSDFVKMLDISVGMYMTIIDKDGVRRRDLYGKAGAFRPKSYGVEYRFPSNVWLISKARRQTIYDLSNCAVLAMKTGYTPEGLTQLKEEEIQRILNTGDYESAYKILKDLIRSRFWSGSNRFITNEYDARVKAETAKEVA